MTILHWMTVLSIVYHYRDKEGLECDAVIHLRNGKYGLAEIKLGGSPLIEEGAKTLKTLASKIDTGKMKEPSFLTFFRFGISHCRSRGSIFRTVKSHPGQPS